MDQTTFKYVAGSMYARHIFDIEAKRQLEDMTDYVRKAFNEILQNIDWMDKDTKKEAFNKLEKMHQTLAYPEEFVDQDKIDGLYKGLIIKENDYFGNIMSLSIHLKKLKVLKLKSPFIVHHFEKKLFSGQFNHAHRGCQRRPYDCGVRPH